MKKMNVLINCKLGKETFPELKEFDYFTQVHGTFGAYDMVAEILSDAESQRNEITWKIKKIPSICSTLMLLLVEGQN